MIICDICSVKYSDSVAHRLMTETLESIAIDFKGHLYTVQFEIGIVNERVNRIPENICNQCQYDILEAWINKINPFEKKARTE